MATVIFQGLVGTNLMRVVDFGPGQLPRLAVELQEPADAMGAHGWGRFDPIPTDVLSALLLAAHVIA